MKWDDKDKYKAIARYIIYVGARSHIDRKESQQAAVKAIAEELGRSTKSVTSKLQREGVYIKGGLLPDDLSDPGPEGRYIDLEILSPHLLLMAGLIYESDGPKQTALLAASAQILHLAFPEVSGEEALAAISAALGFVKEASSHQRPTLSAFASGAIQEVTSPPERQGLYNQLETIARAGGIDHNKDVGLTLLRMAWGVGTGDLDAVAGARKPTGCLAPTVVVGLLALVFT